MNKKFSKFFNTGRLCVNIFKNSKFGMSVSFMVTPDSDFSDAFTNDWGIATISIHLLKYRVEIEYRFGKKCFLGNKLGVN